MERREGPPELVRRAGDEARTGALDGVSVEAAHDESVLLGSPDPLPGLLGDCRVHVLLPCPVDAKGEPVPRGLKLLDRPESEIEQQLTVAACNGHLSVAADDVHPLAGE